MQCAFSTSHYIISDVLSRNSSVRISTGTLFLTDVTNDCAVTGLVPTIERRYRAQQMALWLDLIPRLHRAPDLVPANFGPDGCYHQLDDAERDSTFEPHAARVSDSDCSRKHTSTVQLPVSATSFPVVTRRPNKHAEQRRTTRSDVTPRYTMEFNSNDDDVDDD